MHIWTLAGIGVVIVGFVARLNPLLVIIAAALVTGWAGGLDPVRVFSAFGFRQGLQRQPLCVHRLAGPADDRIIGARRAAGARAEAAIARHLQAALAHISGDYMGEHWLASFALLALDPD